MNFKKRLTFEEANKMIHFVANAVFKTNEETGETRYIPELYDYSFRIAVAHYYGGFTLTDDMEANYQVAMDVNLSELRDNGNIDFAQLGGIEQAIYEKIDMQKEEMNKTNITVTSQFDALVPAVETLIETITNKVMDINMEQLNQSLGTWMEELADIKSGDINNE